MSVFVIIVIAFLKYTPEPLLVTHLYDSKAECQAHAVEVTKTLVKENAQKISVTCIERKLGEPS